MRFTLVATSLLVALSGSLRADDADVRRSIERALPYVVEWGEWWKDEKKCMSCHRVSFTTWALDDARRHGFEVNAEQLTAWQTWCRTSLLENKEGTNRLAAVGNQEGVAQLLWSERNRTDAVPAESTERLRALLVQGQLSAGTWKPGGQLPGQKRPKDETAIVSTMWAALALGTFEDDESRAARVNAMKAVNAAEPGSSTEWYAMRLLLADQNDAASARAKWTAELRKNQREDGGWGWLVADESDALATGQAVYAFLETGVPRDDPAVRRAVRFLVTTQTDDGSWSVNGTKTKGKDGPEETAGYWGTCWATIALLRTLPARRTRSPSRGQ